MQLYYREAASWIKCDTDVASTMRNAVAATVASQNTDTIAMKIVN